MDDPRSNGDHPPEILTRRDFLRLAGTLGAGAVMAGGCGLPIPSTSPDATAPHSMNRSTRMPTTRSATTAAPATATATPRSLVGKVALVRTGDRAAGVRRALDLLGVNPVDGRETFIKPNFNSADPAPGSTHNDVLRSVIEWARARGAGRITVGDRAGMGDTRWVMKAKGVFDMASELDFETLVFEEMPAEDWIAVGPAGTHWKRGFAIARPVAEAEALVQLCNLKTHRFGGHFTLSLKNSVGVAAKRVPGDGYNYMTELHDSPSQRSMIAEINAAYAPALLVMDGVEAFIKGGPEAGTKVRPEVVLAGADRVALDAVGVAILRDRGATGDVAQGHVFEQEQIRRAVELGIGVSSPEAIELVTEGDEAGEYAERLREILQTT
jgi:uncharacterized protein (DUF362 family)